MNNLKNKIFLQILLLTLAAASLQFSVYAQTDSATVAVSKSKGFQELKLDSKLMKREMPYRVILPAGYEVNKSEKFPVVYLLHGLTGHYNDWTDRTKLVDYAKNYNYIIVMPEGNDGWYSDSANIPDDKYESYIMQELVPGIEKNFRALTGRENRAIAGLSMGGYGSLKFGLKYPDKFVLAGSFSGALRAAEWTEKEIGGSGWKPLIDSIKNVYGAADSETRRQNDIFKILNAKSADQIKSLPFFYLDCGTEDMLVLQARDFNLLLAEKKIPHEYRELPGVHNWVYWNSQVLEFLRVSERFIVSAKAKSN